MSIEKSRRLALEELLRRKEAAGRVDFNNSLFGEQRRFVTSPSKFKAALCTRRAGKTYGLVLYMLKVASTYSYAQVPYITLTRAQAKRNIWLLLEQLNKEWKLGGKLNRNELTVTLPNGSIIFLCGANDETEIQRLRGGKYPLVVIDEGQNFRPFIRSLIRSILEPALSDYDGTLVLAGTPGVACSGFFYDVTTKPELNYDVFTWSSVDNPYHPHTPEKLATIRKRNNWLPDNPTFVREYLGQWVHDDSRVVYKIQEDRNVVHSLPAGELTYVLGIDLGYEDSTAMVVLGYDDSTGYCWVVESKAETKLIPSAVAARVDRLAQRYDFTKIVADTGGFGKGYVEEMNQRFGMFVEPAQKSKKLTYIELLNGDLQSGVLRFYKPRNQELIDELGSLLWLETTSGEVDHTTIDERFPNHLSDALLYGWRACRQYFYSPEENKMATGSVEYWKVLEDQMEADQLRLEGLSQHGEGLFPRESLDSGVPLWLEPIE